MRKNKPSWSDQLLDAVDAQGKVNSRISVGLNFPISWKILILRAAEKRNISLAAYCRRAAMAFVMHDLGMDWKTVMRDEPRVDSYGNPGIVHDPKSIAQGYGYGDWKITGLGRYDRDHDE